MVSDIAVAKSRDIEFSSKKHFEEFAILGLEEIEASVVTSVEVNACRDLVQGLDTHRGVIEAGEEFEVSVIASMHKAG